MNVYPYSTPIILTDSIFAEYGGHTGTSTTAQRNAAYFIAEKAASYDIETLLLPTIITGTFLPVNPVVTDWGYVSHLHRLRLIGHNGEVYYSTSDLSGIASIRNDTYGIVDVYPLIFHSANPYQIELVYEAGLPTGTATQADVLLALTTYADIILNEILGYGNEAPGDIGVQAFSNQQYSERRVAMLRTAYGTSARANFAHNILKGLRKYRYVGL